MLSLPAYAGEPSLPPQADIAPPAPGWQFFVTLPGWGAGFRGDVGVGGFDPVSVDVGLKDILKNLDMIAPLTVEARNSRWGFIADGMYLKMSAAGETPGRLLTSVDVELEEVLAELAVTYRLIEGPRGYLDLIAGARYMYLSTGLNFHLDSAGVRDVSQDLSDAAVNRAVGVIQKEVGRAAARARAKLATLELDERAEALRGEVREVALQRLLEQTTIREIIETIRDLTPAEREQIRQKVESSQQVLAANKALTKAVIEERTAAAVSAARKQAQRAVARAKRQLAGAIESAIRKAVPSEAAASKSWVDPFVGLRGRLNLTDKVYFAARADVGGFGVASDITWNLFGALGYQLSERWSTELGWRHYSVDYQDGGFIFDAEMSGVYLGLTLKL
jgi:hypothetical protein